MHATQVTPTTTPQNHTTGAGRKAITPHAQAGRASKAISPWGRGAHCDTIAAAKSYLRYVRAGKGGAK